MGGRNRYYPIKIAEVDEMLGVTTFEGYVLGFMLLSKMLKEV